MPKAATKKALDPIADFDNPVRREPSLEATSDDGPVNAHVSGKKALMHFVRVRHILRLYEVSDQGVPSIEESSVKPESVVLRTVEETGTGAEQDVTRLSVVVPITQARDAGDWCLRMHGELVWVELVPMQGKLVA